MTKEQSALFEELRGERCYCGRKKRSMESFCPRCYKLLPLASRNHLYRRMGKGYEEAVAEAKEDLNRYLGLQGYFEFEGER